MSHHSEIRFAPKKVIVCLVVSKRHFELLNSCKIMLNLEEYCSQLDLFKSGKEKCPELTKRKSVTFHKDNTRRLKYLYKHGRNCYSFARMPYYIFRSYLSLHFGLPFILIQDYLNEKNNSLEAYKDHINKFIIQKDAKSRGGGMVS